MDIATRLEDGADDEGRGVVAEAAETLRAQAAEIERLRAALAAGRSAWVSTGSVDGSGRPAIWSHAPHFEAGTEFYTRRELWPNAKIQRTP